MIQEREIIRKQLEIDENGLVEAGINAGICVAGLVAAALSRVPAVINGALTACGISLGTTVIARLTVATAKITALNARRLKKEYDLNCGEAGVVRGLLKKIGF